MRTKQNYGGLDRFRIAAALFVIAIHTSPLASFHEGADFFLTRVLARIAVPFFFMVTGQFVVAGFLAPSAKSAARFRRYLVKSSLLYVFCILLYLPIGIYAGHYEDLTAGEMLRMLFFDGTFYHLWYFPACILGMLLVYLMSRFLSLGSMTIVSVLLYVIGLFGDSYYGLIQKAPALEAVYGFFFQISSYTRNGLFFAPLFLVLGAWMGAADRPAGEEAARRRPADQQKLLFLGGMALLSFAIMTAEAFLLRHFELQRHDSMYLALIPTMFFFYRCLLCLPRKSNGVFRAVSTWIYVLHPAFIVVVRGIAKPLQLTEILVDNSLVHYLAVSLLSVLAGFVMAFLQSKWKAAKSASRNPESQRRIGAPGRLPEKSRRDDSAALLYDISSEDEQLDEAFASYEDGEPGDYEYPEEDEAEFADSEYQDYGDAGYADFGHPEEYSEEQEYSDTMEAEESSYPADLDSETYEQRTQAASPYEASEASVYRTSGGAVPSGISETGTGKAADSWSEKRYQAAQERIPSPAARDTASPDETIASSRAWIEVDAAALADNVAFLRSRLPEHCRLMPAVKAQAYGHGAVLVSRQLNLLGIDAFCVASVGEAVELRQAGIEGEILILGYTAPADFPLLARYQLLQTIVDYPYARLLDQAGLGIHVHIGIDTGMHRLGIRCENSEELRAVCDMQGIQVDGLFTHLCVTDSPLPEHRAFTEAQVKAFYQAIDLLRGEGYPCPNLHLLASYGIMNLLQGRHSLSEGRPQRFADRRIASDELALAADYVRPGIALYGVLSTEADTSPWRDALRPVLSLKTKVTSLRTLYAGEAAGYGAAFTAQEDMRIAAISIGYADGFPRELSYGRGSVLIDGCRAPVIGRVCMDQAIVDVSHISHVKEGDTAVIIGSCGEEEITVGQVADQCGTISNEILSRLASRLDRVLV